MLLRNGNRLARWAIALGVLGCLAAFLLCVPNPRIASLARGSPAQWILYPKPPDSMTFAVVACDTTFRRSFNLDTQPSSAKVTVRAFRQYSISINGAAIGTLQPPDGDWKHPIELDVTGKLHAGSNEISVVVTNVKAPPALWLSLNAGSVVLNTGPEWEASQAGAAWRQARMATAPERIEKGNTMYGTEDALSSLAAEWPTLLVFAALAMALFYGALWALKRYVPGGDAIGALHSRRGAVILLGVITLVWGALFMNNLPLLPVEVGFDCTAHLDYIEYIRAHWKLPLANQGWEMCQPPLYYAICAVAAAPFGLATYGEGANELFRMLGMLIGVAHFSFIFLSLRVLFPSQLRKQIFGLFIAAFVPQNLYLSHYVTNEALAGTLVAAAIYFCLRILQKEDTCWRLPALTGLCLGGALLTKASALLAAPLIGAALLGWLWSKQPGNYRTWARTLGAFFGITFLVSGWHYLRVWWHFGKPLVHDWDPESGYSWWIDPGFHTSADFLGFGQCLVHPFFSVFHGFWDGLYSTMWGDGLIGGAPNLDARIPWNYQMMAEGYWLALLPTAMILAGAIMMAVKLIRKPQPAWFLLLGLAGATLAALVYMNLKLPFYCNVKSFYGFIALLPICACAGVGGDLFTSKLRGARAAVYVIFGVWVLNTYCSFWVRSGSSATWLVRGFHDFAGHHIPEGFQQYNEALRLDPGNPVIHRGMAEACYLARKLPEARQWRDKLLAEDPDDARNQLTAALIFADEGDLPAALSHVQRAAELAPDMLLAWQTEAAWLVRLGRNREALAAGREALRIAPMNSRLHSGVGAAYEALADHGEALRHLRMAVDLKPAWPEPRDQLGLALGSVDRWEEAAREFEAAVQIDKLNASYHLHLAEAWQNLNRTKDAVAEYYGSLSLDPNSAAALNNLAWILATDADAGIRNGQEAVRLAERACELSRRETPVYLGTLAAAYAEAGRFPDAITNAESAIKLARERGAPQFVQSNQQLLELYRANRPYHQPASAAPHP